MRGALLLLVSALALTLAMAAPVLRSPSERLFGSEIVGRHEAPFVVVAQFEEPRRPGLYTQPVTDYAGAAVAAVVGDGVAACNFVVLATFPLAALFTYLLAWRLTGSVAASWLAGLLYAFAPFHVAQSAYHPHGAQTQWLPLYLLALWMSLERSSQGRSLFLLLTAALAALSNFYYGLMAVLLTPVTVLGFWLVRRSGREGPIGGLRGTLLTLGSAAALGLAYVLVFAPEALSAASAPAFPREDVVQYGARWWSYLTPPVEHPVLARWAERVWARHGVGGLLEQQITVGFGLVALAGVAVARRLRGDRQAGLANVPALALIAAAALLLSLSPPAAAGPLGLVWPASLVHSVLPMFRAYARFGLVVFLAVAILAVIGGAWLWRRRTVGARLLVAGLSIVVAVELAPLPPLRWRDVLPTRAHRWMAEQPAPWRLLDCQTATPSVAWSIIRFLPQPSALLSPLVEDCGEPGLAGRLAALEFSHLLLRGGGPADRWYARRGLPAGLTEVARFDDARVLRVAAAPPVLYVDRWQGFSWREYSGDRTFRWLGPSGDWQLVVGGGAAVEGRLEIELWSLGAARDLELVLGGRSVGRLRVAPEPAWYRVGPMRVGPGRERLAWRPQGPPVVPDDLLGNGDRRPLTVAVGSWRWLPSPDAGDGKRAGPAS